MVVFLSEAKDLPGFVQCPADPSWRREDSFVSTAVHSSAFIIVATSGQGQALFKAGMMAVFLSEAKDLPGFVQCPADPSWRREDSSLISIYNSSNKRARPGFIHMFNNCCLPERSEGSDWFCTLPGRSLLASGRQLCFNSISLISIYNSSNKRTRPGFIQSWNDGCLPIHKTPGASGSEEIYFNRKGRRAVRFAAFVCIFLCALCG